MSHIAHFNLSLDNERRLRLALESIGCQITEGHFNTPWAGMNRDRATMDSRGNVTAMDGNAVVFGFTIRSQYNGTLSGDHLLRFGFTRGADGGLLLVGDNYGTGLGTEIVQNAIENSYVNEGVNEAVESLESMGFFEDECERSVQLQMIA